MSELEQRIIDVVCSQLGLEASQVSLNSDFLKDLGADSLDTVELVMAFEEAFDVEIADDIAEQLRTVRDVMSLISNQLAA
jgi:acyl carrier protein